MSSSESRDESRPRSGDAEKPEERRPSALDHHLGHREELIPLVRDEDTVRGDAGLSLPD